MELHILVSSVCLWACTVCVNVLKEREKNYYTVQYGNYNYR